MQGPRQLLLRTQTTAEGDWDGSHQDVVPTRPPYHHGAPAASVDLPAGPASGGPTAAPGTAGASPSPESPTILWTLALRPRARDGKHDIAPNR